MKASQRPRLTLGPLVPIHPHFQRVGEVAADLDEAQPEVGVKDIEVVHRDAAIDFVEAELRCASFGLSGVTHKDPLDFLSDDDGDHTRLGGLIEVFADMIDFAVIPPRAIWCVQVQDWDGIGFGEAPHRLAEAIANVLEECR